MKYSTEVKGPKIRYICYLLFAGLGPVRVVKNCDRGLENAARPEVRSLPEVKNLGKERVIKVLD